MSQENLTPQPELGDSSGMNLLDTELTLGLPGGENRGKTGSKRAFSETVNGEGGSINDSSVVSDQRSVDRISVAAAKAPTTK